MLQTIFAEYVERNTCRIRSDAHSLFSRYHLDPKRTCMIGDRLDTDIEFGVKGGIETLCVLTGRLFMIEHDWKAY